MSGSNSGHTGHKGTRQPNDWVQNATDNDTLDSQCIENTIGYCYAAPAYQIQEVYVGSRGSLLKIQLSMDQMQGIFFADEIH